MEHVTDVIVVGGGPAGAIAAYFLAKLGNSVTLVEKEALPRYKACGGAVPPHVEEVLDFSIEPTIERKVSKVLVTIKLQRPTIVEAPYPFVYMVMRSKFDNFLVEKAESAGAVVYSETPLVGLESCSEGYIVDTPQEKIRCKYLIAADGANGITRKLVGAPRFRRLSVALEREVIGRPDLYANWSDTLALDFGYLRSGYGWVFPKAKNFSMGTGGSQSVAKHLGPYYGELKESYKSAVGDTTAFISKGHYLPIRVRNEKIVFGRTLFIGDAAGLIEPMTGEGIYYAIRSAQIAAETISNALKSGNGDLMDYQRRVDKEIQPELQISKSLLFLLNLAPDFWVSHLMRTDGTFWKYFYRIFTGEKDYQDLPRKFGHIGKIFFGLLDRTLGN